MLYSPLVALMQEIAPKPRMCANGYAQGLGQRQEYDPYAIHALNDRGKIHVQYYLDRQCFS